MPCHCVIGSWFFKGTIFLEMPGTVYPFTWHYIPKDWNPQPHHCENCRLKGKFFFNEVLYSSNLIMWALHRSFASYWFGVMRVMSVCWWLWWSVLQKQEEEKEVERRRRELEERESRERAAASGRDRDRDRGRDRDHRARSRTPPTSHSPSPHSRSRSRSRELSRSPSPGSSSYSNKIRSKGRDRSRRSHSRWITLCRSWTKMYL